MKNLKNCPYIISLEKLDLTKDINLDLNKDIQKSVLGRLDKIDSYRIVYKVDKLKVVGFIMIPKKGKDIPCVIKLRGGSRDFGKITRQHLAHAYAYVAANDYVVITTQYPGVDGGDGKDDWGGENTINSIKVLKNILNWIPKADTKNIGLMGHSRGGLMVYMLLRKFRWAKTAIIGGAPTDEFRAGKEREGWREHQISLYGKSQKELLERSPIKWVNELPKNVPILIVHGSSDWRVTADNSILMSKELYDNKIPHKLVIFEGADHGISEFMREYREESISWLKKYLGKDRKLPNMKFHGR
jgi:dipeptidyl aminopeptidase/acylaminoacyl peptidase